MSHSHHRFDPRGARIAVIIPALNEEMAIGRVLADIPAYVERVIVVDNGSTDRTVERARAAGALVVHEPRKGYGYACLRGMQHAANCDITVFLDGDYSDHPQEMDALVAPLVEGRADMVLGSRLRGRMEPGAMMPHAHAANMMFSLILRVLCGLRVTDIGPFRAMRTEKLTALGMCEGTFGWTLEMMIKAARQGMTVLEVPVSYRKRLGHSKVSGALWPSLKAGVKMFSTLRYCWR